MSPNSLVLAALLAFGIVAAPAKAQQTVDGGGIATAVAHRSFFYVGGQYVGETGKEVMAGQMYVERLAPREIRQRLPIVLIHGAAQTATNWMQTPDGRKGWAEYFVEQGYVVFMVDQPARGRSVWHPDINGKLRMFTAGQIETLFTASAALGKWPQAKLHTQWPGSGRRGDPVFDAFYATQVVSLQSDSETQVLAKAAGAALLDKIGPAILLTHSQSGLLGWVIAEARPQLVKAIVALEPSGPPFHNHAPNNPKARAFGITDIAVAYDPPVASADELVTERQATGDSDGLIPCTLQKGPPRKLVALSKTPVMVAVGEASYHAPYDHCTAAYLQQAGVPTEFVRLENQGIKGNGHMSMIEKNNTDVVGFIVRWLAGKNLR